MADETQDQAPSQITLPTQDSSNSDGSQLPQAPTAQPQSRLGSILSAVAKTAVTGLSGIPNTGRPSFVTGLGQGARAEQADQAQKQDIKFKTFDDQMRAAQLHNQDLAMQAHTQEQADAHESHMKAMHAGDDSWGVQYDTIANHGDAVLDHLKTQTTVNGAAVVPPGTHFSPDGKTILIPKDTPESNAGQLAQFKAVAPALGLNVNVPEGATKLDPKVATAFYNKLQGFDANGDVYPADKLPALIASNQAQRDALATQGAPKSQLDALDGIVSKQQAQLKADKDASDAATKKQLDTLNKTEAIKAKYKEEAQDNAAENKPKKEDTNMYVGTDEEGNQIAGNKEDLAGAKGVTKLDADTGKKVVTARQLVSPAGLFSLIRQDMDALDKKGKLGSSAEARFNDALLQKAGADEDYAPLFVHTHLLSTALMQAHVGSKGSTDMMEEFKKLADSGKMNAKTLRSALGAEFNYVHEKAMLPKKKGAK
jgi:hypothetical protein